MCGPVASPVRLRVTREPCARRRVAASERAAVARNLRRVISFIAPKGKPVRCGWKTMEVRPSRLWGRSESRTNQLLYREGHLARGPLFHNYAEVVKLLDGGFDVAADLSPFFAIGER